MSSWFVNHRVEWIAETVRIFGFINRDHIMRKFGVSVPQASTDLQAAMAAHPDLMRYNVSTKRYEHVGGQAVEKDDLGMTVVPLVPNFEMLVAGSKEWDANPRDGDGTFGVAGRTYRAMLQAFADLNAEKEIR